jgi:hypothetical protein
VRPKAFINLAILDMFFFLRQFFGLFTLDGEALHQGFKCNEK